MPEFLSSMVGYIFYSVIRGGTSCHPAAEQHSNPIHSAFLHVGGSGDREPDTFVVVWKGLIPHPPLLNSQVWKAFFKKLGSTVSLTSV